MPLKTLLRRIESELPKQPVPLYGNAPLFDWDRFSSLLSSRFSQPVSVLTREQKWRSEKELKKGLGTDLMIVPIVISPIGTVFWMMSKSDIAKLTSWMLSGKTNTKITSEILSEGFYRFLMLEGLDALQSMDPMQPFTLHLTEEETLEEKAFCIDVEIEFGQKSAWGRLAIPEDFRAGWVRHFENEPTILSPAAEALPLTLNITNGSVVLTQEEWEALKPGDFVLLDRSGFAALTLGASPLFHVKVKHNKIELLQPIDTREEPMEIKELPLSVTVELARFKTTLGELLKYAPGTMIEVPIHPEQNVTLTVNGEIIGRAELVQLGENIGLRMINLNG